MPATPSPLDLAAHTPATLTTVQRERHRARSCTSKTRYASEQAAEFAAFERMLTNADKPITAYECDYCTGYHLTSSDAPQDNTVDMKIPVAKTPIALVCRIPRAQRTRRGNKSRKPLTATYDRYERADRDEAARVSRLPVPQVASEESAAAFFARHTS